MNELMEEDTNQWNMEKLNDLFPTHVVEMIQEIPIGTSNVDDILIWSYEKKGVYNVRRGYRLLTGYYEEEETVTNESSTRQRKEVT